jgi:hypothetical protein
MLSGSAGLKDRLNRRLTTNGSQLPRFAQELKGLGVRRINISLDTLERKQDGRPEPKRPTSGRPTPPTKRMVAFAERLAKEKRGTLPPGYDKDFDICRRFLDQHATR